MYFFQIPCSVPSNNGNGGEQDKCNNDFCPTFSEMGPPPPQMMSPQQVQQQQRMSQPQMPCMPTVPMQSSQQQLQQQQMQFSQMNFGGGANTLPNYGVNTPYRFTPEAMSLHGAPISPTMECGMGGLPCCPMKLEMPQSVCKPRCMRYN